MGKRARHAAIKERKKASRGLVTAVPAILIGSMAMTMGVTGPVEPVAAKKPAKTKAAGQLGTSIREALASANATIKAAPSVSPAAISTAAAPTTYRVAPGDTVSSIAGRFGLSTASVLALNGLSWKSIIFPGQVLKLGAGATAPTPPKPPQNTTSSRYTIVKGDTIGAIAARFGISTQALLVANGLGWSSIIYPGQTVAIPGLAPASNVTPAPPAPAPATPAPAPAPPAPAPAPAPPAPAPQSSTPYVIVRGDTISKIASRFKVSMKAILDANGLTMGSIIYAGRTIMIPGVSAAGSTAPGTTALNEEMRGNARVIIDIGRELGVSDYGIVIALATAMQESGLRNINWGHLDSVGLFQQRPSAGWGSIAQLTTPSHAARLFYGGPLNPNRGKTRGLLDVVGWQSMSVTQAAQKVQVSAYPNAYAKWEASARAWLSQLG